MEVSSLLLLQCGHSYETPGSGSKGLTAMGHDERLYTMPGLHNEKIPKPKAYTRRQEPPMPLCDFGTFGFLKPSPKILNPMIPYST